MNSLPGYGYSVWYYHLINVLTYVLYRVCKLFIRKTTIQGTVPAPLLITGLFRSGTTITSRLIQLMGYKSGPPTHLLKAKGDRKHLNPKGFLEDYFFMELTLSVFVKTNSWGDAPPDSNLLRQFDLRKLNHDEAVKFSLLQIHDDRISNYNKLKVMLSGDFSRPEEYLKRFYTDYSFIKNPHFAVLMPVLELIFAKSKVLVVFKEPFNALNSAKKVTARCDFNLYISYYRDLVERHKYGNSKIMFFSYENLISHTLKSIDNLCNVLEVNVIDKQMLIAQVKAESKNQVQKEELPKEVQEVYNYMLVNCINSVK